MKRHASRSGIAGLLAVAAAYSDSPPIQNVKVRDANFDLVKELSLGVDLHEVSRYWSGREEAQRSSAPVDFSTFNYKLDVFTNRSTRWLYDPSGGWAVRLSKREQPVFRIRERKAFNELLGLSIHGERP